MKEKTSVGDVVHWGHNIKGRHDGVYCIHLVPDRPAVDCCDSGNEASDFIKEREFLSAELLLVSQ
jgi:hypothetical protein